MPDYFPLPNPERLAERIWQEKQRARKTELQELKQIMKEAFKEALGELKLLP